MEGSDQATEFSNGYEVKLEGPFANLKNTKFLSLIYKKTKDLISKLNKSHPQHGLNGPDHLWILKPGQSSRGRGIEVFNSFKEIMAKKEKFKNCSWVVQKYMENSLLVNGRKFDIR